MALIGKVHVVMLVTLIFIGKVKTLDCSKPETSNKLVSNASASQDSLDKETESTSNSDCQTTNQNQNSGISKRSLNKNFLRFGRSFENDAYLANQDLAFDDAPSSDAEVEKRNGLSKNFLRFGKSDPSSGSAEDVSKRGSGLNKNFLRFGRGRNFNIQKALEDYYNKRGALERNFIRFGRSGPAIENGPEMMDDESNLLESNFDSKRSRLDKNFIRFGRGSKLDDFWERQRQSEKRAPTGLSKNFLRFGRSVPSPLQEQKHEKVVGGHPGREIHHFPELSASMSRRNQLNKNFLRFGRKDKSVNSV